MENMSWLNDPALKNLEPAKKEVFIQIITESKGKPLNQSLPIILKAQATLKAQGLSFTKEETTSIMEILSRNLSPKEVAKVDAIKKMFQ